MSRRFRTPAAAVWLASALAYALPAAVWLLVKAAPRALDFNRLYTAVTGISTIALYLAYGLPVLLKLRARRLGAWTDRTDGPWSLGRWSTPVGAVGILWIAFITVLFVLPPNELTGYMFALTMVALAVLYFTTARGRFKGPVPQAKGEAELARLEAELEQ